MMNVRYACGTCGNVHEEEHLAVKCCNDTAVEVSGCCGSSIDHKLEREYPLGGQTWGINCSVPVCWECGEELV